MQTGIEEYDLPGRSTHSEEVFAGSFSASEEATLHACVNP
jgi:hypothetical protein